MTDNQSPATSSSDSSFRWHPEYAGKPVTDVRATLIREISSDQRTYALTLEGAEEHEGDSLTSVIALERKWGPFDLNWAETDPSLVADRVVAFELERDRRRELFPYSDYRKSVTPIADFPHADPAAQRLESPTARGIVVLVLVLIIIAIWFFVFR